MTYIRKKNLNLKFKIMNVQDLMNQASEALNASKAAASHGLKDAKEEISKLKDGGAGNIVNKLKDGKVLDELKDKAGDVLNTIADKASGLADKLGK